MPAYDSSALVAALASGDVPAILAALPEDDSLLSAVRKASNLLATPSNDLHDLHAAVYSHLSGVEISPKQVQVVLSLHGATQRSEANRHRSSYRGRTVASLRRGAETLRDSLSAVRDGLPGAVAARRLVESEIASAATASVAPVAETVAAEQVSAPAPKPAPKGKAPTRRRTPAKSVAVANGAK